MFSYLPHPYSFLDRDAIEVLEHDRRKVMLVECHEQQKIGILGLAQISVKDNVFQFAVRRQHGFQLMKKLVAFIARARRRLLYFLQQNLYFHMVFVQAIVDIHLTVSLKGLFTNACGVEVDHQRPRSARRLSSFFLLFLRLLVLRLSSFLERRRLGVNDCPSVLDRLGWFMALSS